MHGGGCEIETDDEQSGGDGHDYMQQMRVLIQKRELELTAWTAAQSDEHEFMDDGAPRLGPEGTVLVSENASSYGGDTDIGTDDEELAALQHRQNHRAQALGLEPTIIIGPGQYESPRRTLPRWNLDGEQASRALGLEPTELVL
jgi:hypothetical protein